MRPERGEVQVEHVQNDAVENAAMDCRYADASSFGVGTSHLEAQQHIERLRNERNPESVLFLHFSVQDPIGA